MRAPRICALLCALAVILACVEQVARAGILPRGSLTRIKRQPARQRCEPAESCVGGFCTDNTVGIDSYNCGSISHACRSGELCVLGDCLPLNLSSADPAAGLASLVYRGSGVGNPTDGASPFRSFSTPSSAIRKGMRGRLAVSGSYV